ncbi:hypothetical protein OSB04_004087 [Centaurea solstitialis]|uniref:Fiber protein Fb34 n=1 Tax=Centaurea solstitialis TaxID=347529 RepID=A0AA38U6K4_9ASTR|nr:hypothetical protein OSB04_004087 [Centaurea solstitialis]
MASKLVMIVVSILDLIAFGLAVAAEQRRSTADVKQDPEKDYNFCVYDSDISTSYGVGAFFLLLASQILIMVASRCFCCGKALNPTGSRACAVILFIFCCLASVGGKGGHRVLDHFLSVPNLSSCFRITFIIAEACLLAGSVRNAYHTKYRTIFGEDYPSCETVRKGVFAAGAAFVFLCSIVSQFYYASYSKARGGFQQPYGGEANVGMGAYK